MSKETQAKKIQKKAARRAGRKSPREQAEDAQSDASDPEAPPALAGHEATGVVFDEAEGLTDGEEGQGQEEG